jgi:hypothetical protein
LSPTKFWLESIDQISTLDQKPEAPSTLEIDSQPCECPPIPKIKSDIRSGGVVIDAWEKERAKPGMTLLAACEETIVQVPTTHG